MSDSEAWNSGIQTGSGRSRHRQNDGSSEEVIAELAHAFLDEKRRSRRWGIFFRLMFGVLALLAIAAVFAVSILDFPGSRGGQHTAKVDISGVISAGEQANSEAIVHSLENALSDKDTAGVILSINSPGGSPVESGIVFDEIFRLRNEYPGIPIHAVIRDIGASGGYYIAAAADRIYADKASIVGSIGVRMSSFGFDRVMDNLGIDRRLLTAGEHKGFLDPFSPQNDAAVAHMQSVLDTVHQQFIESVRRGRGERLTNDPNLFSGLFWSGEQAIENGLIDELANESFVAREIIGAPDIVNFTRRQDIFERIMQRVVTMLSQMASERWQVQGIN